jgi:hypothetical protein
MRYLCPGHNIPPEALEDDEVEEHLFSSRHLATLLDLSVGAPGPDILGQLPPLFERLTQHRMAREALTGGDLFQYGPEVGLKRKFSFSYFRENLFSLFAKKS